MTLKEIKDAIVGLQTSLTSLLGKASSEAVALFQTKLTALETTVTGDLTAHIATIVLRDATISTLTADLAASQTALATAQAATVTASQKADEALAAQGVDPKVIPAAPAPANAAKTMTRVDFEALSHDERSAFMRAGGKLK